MHHHGTSKQAESTTTPTRESDMRGSNHSSPHQARDYNQTPLVVTWEVTQACRLSCDHCRADANRGRDPDELTTTEGKQFLDQLTEFGNPMPILVFSGGDPLERPDLFELIEYATAIGLRTGVTPAPTRCLTRSVLEKFKSLGVNRIALSLDGATADRHDSFRGEEGSFEIIHKAAKYATEIELPLQINTTVTANTVTDLPKIADLVESLNAVMWEVFFLVPVGRGESLAQLSPEMAESTLEWLFIRQQSAPFRVITVEAPHYRRIAATITQPENQPDLSVGSTGDGNGFIFVSHTGEIFPSGFLPRSVGSVKTDTLVAQYRNAALLTNLRDPKKLRGTCGACQYRTVCGGSRARAYAATGDPLASDPLCIRTSSN